MAASLDQYIVAAAPPAAAPPSAAGTRVPAAAFVAALVVIVLCLVWRARAREAGETGVGDALAAAGWTLFTREGCGFCDRQMDELGGSYPRRVRCDGGTGEAAACDSLEGFPAWRNARTGVSRTGLQTGADLRAML